MARFYHFTPVKNLSSIYKDGKLKPASQTGNRNAYFMGIQGDPNYIYLWHPNVMKKIGFLMMLRAAPNLSEKTQALLEIDIEESLVERDYDQLLYPYRAEAKSEEARQNQISLIARDYKLEISEYTEWGIKKAVDAASDEQWNKKPGSYRTAQPITKFKVVRWNDFISIWLRLLAKIAGPALVKILVAAEKKRAKE